MIKSGVSVELRTTQTYIVEQHPHGVIIRGTLPLTDFCALANSATERGFDLLDAGIGSALGHVTVFTNKEHGDLWRAEIEADLVKRYPGDLQRQWFFGCDTGTSSVTMFLVLMSLPTILPVPWLPSVPHDPDDFGRCYRLLERFPEWKARLGAVAAKHAKWKPLVEAWDQLEALWIEESPTKSCPKLYELMQQLRKEKP